jgi:phosphoribosylformylglycinamidine cyclo-ligase
VTKSEYAKSGVDYTYIEPFKRLMRDVSRKTTRFPNCRKIFVDSNGIYKYHGRGQPGWFSVTEGLGHKNLIAQWMYENASRMRVKTYHQNIGIDTMLMAVNDVIAHGAMPVTYTDEVASASSRWYEDEKRSQDIANGFLKECKQDHIALIGGESPALPLLMNSEPYVMNSPSFSGCVVGIIKPGKKPFDNKKVKAGDCIIGVTSSGLHSNGSTLIIQKSRWLADELLTKLPNGNTLGEESLIPTRSYVALIEALQSAKTNIHGLLPGTGGGVSKIASVCNKNFTYRIHSWVEVPIIFQFMQSIGVSTRDCLLTFNWGIGYYIFAPYKAVAKIISIGEKAGYELREIGRVEKGTRKVIFEPENITLPPPGE